jgi:hypothetical protein
MTHAAPSPARRLARTSAALLLALPVLAGLVVTSAPAGADEQSPAVLTTVPLETVAGPQDEVEVEGAARHASRVGVRGGRKAEPLLVSSTATGYTPGQVRAHLGLTGTGAGQTIAIVTAYDAPNVVADLAVFNRTFSLPAPPSFRKVNQSGGSKLPSVNATWALETALDVQWAHAVAPDAHLLLVEASSSAMGNLLAAVTWAASQPGGRGHQRQLGHPRVLRPGRAGLPLPAGHRGLRLRLRHNGGQARTRPPCRRPGGGRHQPVLGPTALSCPRRPVSGSGGGVSLYSPKPLTRRRHLGARRASPDVAYAAGEPAGFPVYSTTPYNRQTGWFQMSGTSAAPRSGRHPGRGQRAAAPAGHRLAP